MHIHSTAVSCALSKANITDPCKLRDRFIKCRFKSLTSEDLKRHDENTNNTSGKDLTSFSYPWTCVLNYFKVEKWIVHFKVNYVSSSKKKKAQKTNKQTNKRHYKRHYKGCQWARARMVSAWGAISQQAGRVFSRGARASRPSKLSIFTCWTHLLGGWTSGFGAALYGCASGLPGQEARQWGSRSGCSFTQGLEERDRPGPACH